MGKLKECCDQVAKFFSEWFVTYKRTDIQVVQPKQEDDQRGFGVGIKIFKW